MWLAAGTVDPQEMGGTVDLRGLRGSVEEL
jgi:hypothetical protein